MAGFSFRNYGKPHVIKSDLPNSIDTRSSSLENPNVSFNQFFTSSSFKNSTSDIVTHETAMQLSIVYAIIRIISEDIASLSYNLITNKDGQQLVDYDNPINKLLNKPNDLMSGFHFREAAAMNTVSRGNSYSKIHFDSRGIVGELELLNNDDVTVTVERINGRKQIFYHLQGERIPLMSYEMLHYKGLSGDGIVGISPISTLKHTIGENISAQNLSQDFYDGGARLSGVLEAPGTLSEDAYNRIKMSWREKHEGRNSTDKTALLEEGMTYKPISLSPVDADILKTRKFGLEELIRPFRIPLHMVASLDRSTNNNIEHQALEYVKFCLRQWAKRFEVEDHLKLIRPKDQSRSYFEHNMESLLRGDTMARAEYLSKMFNIGVYSQDDIRAILKEPRIGSDSATAYYTPVNLMNREKETLKSEDKNTDAA